MVRFLSLSSGSNGNCYYFGNDRMAFLIDIGIGARTIKKRLAEHGLLIDAIDAVFVTHDHFDHIKSLGTFTERYQKPVYLTRTLEKALRTLKRSKTYAALAADEYGAVSGIITREDIYSELAGQSVELNEQTDYDVVKQWNSK